MSATEAPAPPKPRWARWVFFLSVTVISVVADQLSKLWALEELRIKRGGSWSVVNGEDFSIAFTFVRNPGAAWGLLADADESFRAPFFFVVSLAAMALILYLFWRTRRGQLLLATALPLIFGGALGNFIDRSRFQYVVDFIDFRYGSFRWPTFNIADVVISIGVGLLFIDMVVGTIQDLRRRGDPPEPD